MDRIALVIGNQNYLYSNKLHNPINDANDISYVLKSLNFEVTTVLDATLLDIQKAINTFLQDLDNYSVGLLFYAGHGMQIDGKNYIIPTDFSARSESQAKVSCYSLDAFLNSAASYKGKTLICILDACRDNPYTAGRGLSAGFAPIDCPQKGTIIAYSTSADCGAFDGDGSNGLYTQVLKDAMLIPNLKIEEMFKSVRNQVSEISLKVYGEEQLSWEYSSLVGDFYFSVKSQSVNTEITDQELYNFITKRRKYYESTSEDYRDIECLPYVDAYEKYKLPLIKILRACSRIDYKKNGNSFTDATIDEINFSYINSWGFSQKYGRWYYKNHYIEMGDLLPLPDDLQPKDPVDGKALNIDIGLKAELKEGKIRLLCKSNIPDTTPIMFTIKNHKYTAQNNALANNGVFTSAWFSDKGKPLKDGFYMINITCPIDKVLPPEVQKVFGERNRNICGKSTKFNPISGKTIDFSSGLVINSNSVTILSLNKPISEL